MIKSPSKQLFAFLLVLLLVSGTALALRPAANTTRDQAEAARTSGDWRTATTLYQRLVDTAPSEPATLLTLAELRLLRGENDAALALVDRTLLNQPTAAQADQAQLLRGWLALQSGDPLAATADWNAVSAAQQGPANVLRMELALRSGDVISATNWLNAAGSLAGNWRVYAQWRAAQLALTDAPSTTLQLLDDLDLPALPSALPPLDPWSLPKQAAALRDAALLEPDARRISLARMWADEGLVLAARAILATIPADSSFSSLASNEDARLRWALGDPRGALADLSAAVARFPNVPALRRTQTTLAAATGDTELARAALLAATQMDGLSAENYVSSATLAVALQDFTAATAAYDLAIAATPLTGTFHLQAANFYIAAPLRVCSSGRDHTNRAIGTEVDRAARSLAAQLALRCNDPLAVLQVLAPSLTQTPDDPQTLYLVGAALWRLGYRDFARFHLERAANRAPASVWMREAEKLIGSP